jgi:hypothetical protein
VTGRCRDPIPRMAHTRPVGRRALRFYIPDLERRDHRITALPQRGTSDEEETVERIWDAMWFEGDQVFTLTRLTKPPSFWIERVALPERSSSETVIGYEGPDTVRVSIHSNVSLVVRPISRPSGLRHLSTVCVHDNLLDVGTTEGELRADGRWRASVHSPTMGRLLSNTHRP